MFRDLPEFVALQKSKSYEINKIVNSENVLERLNKSVNRLIYKTLIVSLFWQ